MFCINCGGKLVEGAKFCSNCGTGIVAIPEQEQEKIVFPETIPVVAKSTQDLRVMELILENVIEDAFSSLFHIRGEFGKQVFIAEKDKIIHEEDIREHFLSGSLDEKLLMVFEYQKNIGFVITNQRIIWDYERGLNEIFLTNIKNVTIGKSGLATIMRLTSSNNEVYPKIYLTGISKEEEFVFRFRKMIDTIHKKLCNDKITKNDTDFIVRSCKDIKIDNMYCEVGNPTIQPSSKRYQKAKLYFNIPDHEDIYFIYDNTVLGSCKTGFALCTSGYYYCVSQKGYIPWEEFVSVSISKCFGGIQVGREEFTTSGEGKKLIMILKSIQEYLR